MSGTTLLRNLSTIKSGGAWQNDRRETTGTERADPEAKPAAPRKRFSAREKLRILEEADGCIEPGEVGALVRREGKYSSYLNRWRRARYRGQLDGLSAQKRAPKRTVDKELAQENATLRRESERLRVRLEQAETAQTIIEVQENSRRCLVWKRQRRGAPSASD